MRYCAWPHVSEKAESGCKTAHRVLGFDSLIIEFFIDFSLGQDQYIGILRFDVEIEALSNARGDAADCMQDVSRPPSW